MKAVGSQKDRRGTGSVPLAKGTDGRDGARRRAEPRGLGPAADVMGALARELTCPLCGEKFTCKRWIGCWCQRVSVSKERLRALKAVTDDCVCPSCLSGSGGRAHP